MIWQIVSIARRFIYFTVYMQMSDQWQAVAAACNKAVAAASPVFESPSKLSDTRWQHLFILWTSHSQQHKHGARRSGHARCSRWHLWWTPPLVSHAVTQTVARHPGSCGSNCVQAIGGKLELVSLTWKDVFLLQEHPYIGVRSFIYTILRIFMISTL